MDPGLLETAPEAPDAAWSDAQIGRYVFRRLVGSGGMGVVVAAHDPELDREVAIKIVAGGDETSRPIREAQAMARLSHPNVVQVYEVLRLGTRTAIVMELVEGEELGEWQKREERSWRAIVDAYVQASRGLAAAHRAGIVHRDFKPSNLLVDREGVVRVTDFGVAHHSVAAGGPEGLASGPRPLTGIVGTPAYMAPEQHRGGAVDARTDQWGLACSLYEALYGRRPFSSAEGAGLAVAVMRGAIEAEPTDSPVPRRIRAAIRRALSTDPDDRFESVDDFAAALAITPRHVPYVVAATIAIASIFTIAFLWTRDTAASPCEGLDGPMRAAWTDTARAALRRRLLAPGVGIPEASIDRALRGLDAYAARWTATRTQVCTDTQQGVRSAEALDTRMRCLDRRLAEVSGLLEGVSAGNNATLRATSDAVAQLRPIDECDDAKDTDARPASPALRSELDAAEEGLARATAALSLGQTERALALADRAIAAGEHAAGPSLIARALVVRGECEDRLGRAAEALASYQRAAKSAARARDHVVVADALSRGFLMEGDRLGRRADALRSRPYVELALESAGQPDAVRAEWLHFLAILLYDDSSLIEEAVTHERESLAIRQRTLPANHVYILDSLETLGNIEAMRRNYEEARRLLTHVLEARIAARGPNDASVSSVYSNLGAVELRRNDLLAALDYLQPAVDIARASPSSSNSALYNLAITQLELGRATTAAASFAAALEVAERVTGTESALTGDSAMFLGAAWIAAGDHERGRPLVLRGLAAARRFASPRLATALAHAARLALHDGERARARALLAESLALPATNDPIRKLVAAELAQVETGCAAARPLFATALESSIKDGERRVQSLATVGLALCEIAAGDTAAARQRLETELAWFAKVESDDAVRAPARAALAKTRR